MNERTKNFVVRLSEDEHRMVSALAEASGEPMTAIIRRLLRIAYVERFGVTPSKRPSRHP